MATKAWIIWTFECPYCLEYKNVKMLALPLNEIIREITDTADLKKQIEADAHCDELGLHW